MHIRIYVRKYIRMCVCMYTSTYVCTHVYNRYVLTYVKIVVFISDKNLILCRNMRERFTDIFTLS